MGEWMGVRVGLCWEFGTSVGLAAGSGVVMSRGDGLVVCIGWRGRGVQGAAHCPFCWRAPCRCDPAHRAVHPLLVPSGCPLHSSLSPLHIDPYRSMDGHHPRPSSSAPLQYLSLKLGIATDRDLAQVRVGGVDADT